MNPLLPVIFAFGLLALLGLKSAGKGSTMVAPSNKIAPPTPADWLRVCTPGAVVAGIQPSYVHQWNGMEGGYNPCAIGYPPAKGPDGNPRELGIGQFYNPDDLQFLKLTGSQLRAYCVPGSNHQQMYKGKMVTGFSQELSRPLTDAEIQAQADGLIGLIKKSMTAATHDLHTINAGALWSPNKRSYWALVKLQHGLPDLSRSGLPLVTKLLGRPPKNWSELRDNIPKCTYSETTEGYRSEFPAILDNAEKCSMAFVEQGVA